MIFYLGHKEEDRVDEKVRLNRNAQKAWKYGYCEEYDTIIISKDGTLGPIFYVNGIRIGLPEPPKDRKQILNWDKTSKNQKWKREDLPKGLTEKTQYDPQYEVYIREEIKRRKQGVWMFLKGELVYLTGLSYYFYQWNKLATGYPDFRIIQNELMLYWEACKADYRCYGICYVKNRRFGWSSICNAELLMSGTTSDDKELGIISKSGTDARKMFKRLIRTFKKLPSFFTPVWDGTTTPKKELLLSEPTRKKKIDEEEAEIEEGLDTSITWFATTLNSMDGDPVYRSALDEVGKFPADCRFDDYWDVVKTSHTVGEDITGKAMVGSTVNPMEEGGKEFKSVYDDSNPLERNENEETLSGLYKLFIPAQYGLQGYYDSYGFCILEDPKIPVKNDKGRYKSNGSITYLKNKFNGLKHDTVKQYKEQRKFPRTEKEAFRKDTDECEFNLAKIVSQIEHNEDESNHNENGSEEIERGNFTWKDGILDTEVIWRPDPKNGRFWLKKGCHPPEEYRNKKEMLFKYGIRAWAPMAEHVGALGADPYNRDKGADGRGSYGGISGSTKANTWENFPNNNFFLEYIDRPKKVKQFFEDVIMCCVYFSMPFLGELSNVAFLQHITDRGYRHFSLNNPLKLWKDLSDTEEKLGGANPQGNLVADAQFYATEAFIEDHVGVSDSNTHRPLGTMGEMVFNRTLEQWKDVDMKNRTKFDAYIASSLSRLANQKRIFKKKENTKQKRNPFTQYDNSGRQSKRQLNKTA